MCRDLDQIPSAVHQGMIGFSKSATSLRTIPDAVCINAVWMGVHPPSTCPPSTGVSRDV
jgi:hypothetical protein